MLLLEAGDDQGDNLTASVPAFHAFATEDAALRWDFFVKHYDDDEQAVKDPKMTWETPDGSVYIGLHPPSGSQQKGIYYPRAGTLGGCTMHNALVAVLPPDADWEYIAQITNDQSWNPQAMRRYWERLERCQYLPDGTAGHGFSGWLETEHTDPEMLTSQEPFIKAAMKVVSAHGPGDSQTEIYDDINSLHPKSLTGVYKIPLSMSKRGRRSSPRDYLVATASARKEDGSKKYHLHIRTKSLVTRVLFSESAEKPRAVGVEFLEGKSLYKADPRYIEHRRPPMHRVYASREVILAGGVFNTPQLLKLSGIGPKEEIEYFGIPPVMDLPGVGTNLQDNYEYAVIIQSDKVISAYRKSLLGYAGDALLEQWVSEGTGPYKANGDSMGMRMKSEVSENGELDIFIFAGTKAFSGFFPAWSRSFSASINRFCWNILKVHPRNSTAGTVKLRSANPQDMPEINFRYFDGRHDSNDPEHDLIAMADAVTFVRELYVTASRPERPLIEESPGPSVRGRQNIMADIKNNCFGHHASSTCAIGADDDPMACLNSRFQVRGVEGLRVVDASVFPRVPGSFPQLATYMISEKATDVIVEDEGLNVDLSVLEAGLGDLALRDG